MVVKWTQDKIDFVLKNYSREKRFEVTERFKKKFNEWISVNGIHIAYHRFKTHFHGKVKA